MAVDQRHPAAMATMQLFYTKARSCRSIWRVVCDMHARQQMPEIPTRR